MGKLSYLIFALLIFSSLILSSCTTTKSNEGNIGTVDLTVLTGKEGLTFELQGLSQTEEVFENDILQFGIKVTNNGAANSNVKIMDPVRDKRYIPNIDIEDSAAILGTSFSLEGLSLERQTPEFEVFQTQISTSELSITEDKRTETVTFNMCYSYETNFESDVCVDTDVYNSLDQEKVCTSGPKTFSKGQGAPIEVAAIDLNFISRENNVIPKIKFTLRNSGGGNVLSRDAYNSFCQENVQNIPNAEILISELKFGDYNLNNFECIPSEENRNFDNNQLILTCTLRSDATGISKSAGTYTSKITAKFSYFYKTSNSVNIVIKKTS